jgi:L-serine dehydratase, iron-sulfur-dependent, beta subunit
MIIHSDQKVPESVICRIKEGNKNINSVMTLDII